MAEEISPIRPRIRKLALGQSVDFPIKRMFSIKNCCTTLGVIYSRKFKTTLDREQGVIIVTRIK